MNERIQELAIQSGFKKYKDDDLYSPYIEGEPLNDELQEFAENIIKECVKVCTEGQQEEHVMGLMYSKKIKRHFGVK